jgi:protein phosphatase
MRLRAGAQTDVGRVRALNEDAFACDPARGWFIVADGMGGAPAGEVASQLAVQAMAASLAEAHEQPHPNGNGDSKYAALTVRLAAAVHASNALVYAHAQQDAARARMGTTVVSLWIDQYIASIAHVGDSRAYLWHDGLLEALTEDHSLVEAHVRAGVIAPHDRATAPHQNVLTRVVGREPTVQVDVNEVPVRPGDYLLLCTDGLSRTVPEAAIAEAIGAGAHPQQMCEQLVTMANQNGGGDNVTAVIVEISGSWWRTLWSRSRDRMRRSV